MKAATPSFDPEQSGTIHLRLRELAQLFNSMDPSPFLDRDLDRDAEEFIVGWAREFPPQHELKLIISLTTPPTPERATETQDAIRRYFTERANSKRRDFRQLMKRGRTSLVIGLLFLAGCLTIGNLFDELGVSNVTGILKESFVIVGWVAMWRPLEIYLYDWWPLRAEWQRLERLSRMQVQLVAQA